MAFICLDPAQWVGIGLNAISELTTENILIENASSENTSSAHMGASFRTSPMGAQKQVTMSKAESNVCLWATQSRQKSVIEIRKKNHVFRMWEKGSWDVSKKNERKRIASLFPHNPNEKKH